MDFKGKVVLITGGCSGIGKIMARKSLERDCKHLILLDINEQGLLNVKQEFSHFGKLISTFTLDLGILEEIRKVGEQIKMELGAVDILINNAGVVTGTYFHEHSH